MSNALNMKSPVFFLLLICINIISCQHKNYIYLVRHAEKGSEPAGNVNLNERGYARAEALKDVLVQKKITYIFSTNTNRSQETAQPLSNQISIPISNYANDTLGKFVSKCLGLKQNILIVGHSNTVIIILDSFHVSHTVKQFPETNYNSLFIITLKKGKVANFKETVYGRPSNG